MMQTSIRANYRKSLSRRWSQISSSSGNVWLARSRTHLPRANVICAQLHTSTKRLMPLQMSAANSLRLQQLSQIRIGIVLFALSRTRTTSSFVACAKDNAQSLRSLNSLNSLWSRKNLLKKQQSMRCLSAR